MTTRRRPGRGPLIGVVLAIALIGCSSSTPSGSTGPTGSPNSNPTTVGSPPTPEPTAPPSCAATTLAGMTEAQRVGQLFIVALDKDIVSAATRDAIRTYHLGSFWYKRTTVGVAALRAVSDQLQALATSDATARVGFLLSANQEGGQIQGLSGPGFDTIPSALVQGGWSTDDLQAKASAWGDQLVNAGLNVDFAPVADVVPPGTDSSNAPIGQLQREYGHDVDTVGSHVVAFISGMQDAGISPVVKHFPGLGRVAGNTDNTAAVIDAVTTTDDAYLDTFASAVDFGTPFVMISLATYTKIDPGNLAAFSPTIMGDLLRGKLGFDGVIMSDTLSAAAVLDLTPAVRAVRFLEAGGDLIVLNPLATAITMAKAVLSRTTINAAFKSRVDDAVLRILEAKDAVGLLPCG
jgi:beta-N-acetylhexosaminidase